MSTVDAPPGYGKHVCVVGGTRFFGAGLVRLLLDAGHRVTVLTRGTTPDSHGDAVDRLTADANDADALEAAVTGRRFDVVVHQMIYSPVAALAALQAFEGRASRLIMTSTIEVYAGAASPDGGWSEDQLDPAAGGFDTSLPWLDPDFADANYARGKREAEAVLLTSGMPVTIVRLGHVLAANEFTGRLDWFAARVRDDIAIADGPPSSFAHADDVAALFAWLVEHPIAGAINAASQPPFTPADLAAAFGAVPTDAAAERSPFHYEESFVMNTDRITAAGFRFRSSAEWLTETAEAHVA